MSEKFHRRTHAVLQLAQYWAKEFGQEYVGTEHALMAIIQEGTSSTAKVLQERGVDLGRISDQAASMGLKEAPCVTDRNLTDMPRLRQAIAWAHKEAEGLQHDWVCPIHLLLGMLHDECSNGMRILKRLAVEPNELRQALITAYQEKIVKKVP